MRPLGEAPSERLLSEQGPRAGHSAGVGESWVQVELPEDDYSRIVREAEERLQAREQRQQQSLASPPLYAAGITAHSRARPADSQAQAVERVEPPPEQDSVQAALARAEALSGELQRVLGSDGNAAEWARCDGPDGSEFDAASSSSDPGPRRPKRGPSSPLSATLVEGLKSGTSTSSHSRVSALWCEPLAGATTGSAGSGRARVASSTSSFGSSAASPLGLLCPLFFLRLRVRRRRCPLRRVPWILGIPRRLLLWLRRRPLSRCCPLTPFPDGDESRWDRFLCLQGLRSQ